MTLSKVFTIEKRKSPGGEIQTRTLKKKKNVSFLSSHIPLGKAEPGPVIEGDLLHLDWTTKEKDRGRIKDCGGRAFLTGAGIYSALKGGKGRS